MTPASYRIGGTINGVTGSGLVLQDGGADDLAVPAGATSFWFATKLQTGAAYAVTVKAHPTSPPQFCSVVGGTGTVGSADVASVVVTCTAVRYRVGGTIQGLSGAGLVLQDNGADDLAVLPGETSFQFAGALAAGAGYDVTVKTQPSGQTCSVENGVGVVGTADVASVVVACVDAPPVPHYRIGGTVSGLTGTGLVLQDNGGDDLAVPAGATWFEFVGSLATGASYAVTVKTQPTQPAQSCTVAGGSGTVASADVSSVAVSCVDTVVQRWVAPTTWGSRWTASATMVQHAWFDGTRIVEDPAAGTGISWSVANGSAPPQRELKAFPSGSRWGAGPFTGQRYQAAGDSGVAALTGDLIVCALVKPDFDPTVDPSFGIGHEKPIIAKGVTQDWTAIAGGGWALTQTRESFTFHYTYLAHSDGRTVHAFVSVPTFFATHAIGTDGDPSSVRYQQGTGPLDPSYVVFCGGRSQNKIYAAVNGIALDYVLTDHHYPADVGNVASIQPGPPYTLLDAGSHPLTIGGYDTGDPTKVFGGRVYETAIWAEAGVPAALQEKLAAIQGLAPGARYVRNREAPFYGPDAVPGTDAAGYHTAWHDGPRIDAVKGFLFGLQSWNRASGYSFIDSGYAQSSAIPFIFAPGDDLGLDAISSVVRPSVPGDGLGDTAGWTTAGGASVAAAGTVQPPGDSEQLSAKLVTLPPGGALRAVIRDFDSAGPIHGQIWLRRPSGSTGTLRISTSYAPTLGSNYFDVSLAGLPQDTWKRVWLYRSPGGPGNELFTSGGANAVLLSAGPGNVAPITFYAWGLSLTQLGTAVPVDANDPVAGGVRLGTFDPGAEMYDWSASKDAVNWGVPTVPVDALQLPPVPASTAATGFCLAFQGTMPASLPWSAPFTAARTALAWVDDPAAASATARIYVSGATNAPAAAGRLCFAVTGVASPLCAPIPASFGAGTTHRVAACMSAAGHLRIHVDGNATPLASAEGGVPAPDLSGGTLLVGGASVLPVGDPSPWHGYVSRAAVCRSTTDVAGCD